MSQFPEPRFGAKTPAPHALANLAAEARPNVSVTLDSWNARPYNSKVALLSALGGVKITGGAEALHCGASFGTEEAAFVETAQQSVNMLEVGKELNIKPYVYSSAWIGGGLFCDTTYHLALGNTLRNPLCNWAALDVARMTSNSSDLVEGLFKGHGSFTEAADAAGLLAQFLPYQPNNFTFTLDGAHSADNIPEVGIGINAFASRVGGAVFTDGLMAALLNPLPRTMDTKAKLAMHNFITPGRALQGAEGLTEKQSITAHMARLSTERRNPYDGALLHLLAYTLCPDTATRESAREALGAEFLASLTDGLRKFAGARASSAAELGNALEAAVPSNRSGSIPDYVQRDSPGAKISASYVADAVDVGTFDDYALQTVFALIAAKRVFCGAPRFGAGADNHYGLALLNRNYAYLERTNLAGRVHKNGEQYPDSNLHYMNGFLFTICQDEQDRLYAYPCRRTGDASVEAELAFGKQVSGRELANIRQAFPEYDESVAVSGPSKQTYPESVEVTMVDHPIEHVHAYTRQMTCRIYKDNPKMWDVYFDDGNGGIYEPRLVQNCVLILQPTAAPASLYEEKKLPGAQSYYILDGGKPISDSGKHPAVQGGSDTPPTGATYATDKYHLLLVRPNIEHEMLGIILGRGGTDELGATLWGQTELSCYDDSQHGIWGMSYKYHERAQVFNERNMVRVWDVAFDGYNGGMGSDFVSHEDKEQFRNHTEDFTRPYDGKSFIAIRIPVAGGRDNLRTRQLPNPLVWQGQNREGEGASIFTDPEGIHNVSTSAMRLHTLMSDRQRNAVARICQDLPDFNGMEKRRKLAGVASASNECTSTAAIAFQGSMRVLNKGTGGLVDEIHGSGHLGPSYVGVASVREGKGVLPQGAARLQRLV